MIFQIPAPKRKVTQCLTRINSDEGRNLIEAIAGVHRVKPADLRGTKSTPVLTGARAAFALAAHTRGWSNREIAWMLCKRPASVRNYLYGADSFARYLAYAVVRRMDDAA